MPSRRDVDRATQPEADVVVAVVGLIPVAVVGARVVRIVDPRAAAQHPRSGSGAPGWRASTQELTAIAEGVSLRHSL
jgi:hypothetical protein